MESITKQLDELKIDTAINVGVFHHPDMLLHKPLIEHPERPERVMSILSKFESSGLLKKCKVYDKFEPVEASICQDPHGENYVEYIESLWDENSKKEVRYYTDTYYNKHTVNAAKLAVNALIYAVDEMYENKINRAFGVVRPPGHHAAAKSNRIQGFCIYNNVAVAAKYAAKKYGLKRIVVFDWDVHHGDSTSKLFYNDPSILYISLHRFDKGEFYPQGAFGGVEMLGEGDGKGYNLNFPWDLPHKYSSIGDDEYIYALERVFIPIIKKFNPELIFISAGFDSGRGDPLGGLDITPDGFAYMTKRLLDLTPTRTIVALEGGYNLDTISESAEACLRVLLGETLPLITSENCKTFEEMKIGCRPNQNALDTVKKVIEVYSEHWPILNEDAEGLEFEKNIASGNQGDAIIAAGHSNMFIIKQDKLLKKTKQYEIDVYTDLQNATSIHLEDNKIIKNFVPQFLGTFQLQDNYIILENLLFKRPKASVLDIKLGSITYPLDASEEKKQKCIAKTKLTTSGELGFRISGLIIKDKKGKIIEKGSQHEIYFGITAQNLSEYLGRFLKSNESEAINQEALKYYLKFVGDLTNFFENHSKRSWIGSSVLFMLDNTTSFYKANWIDIGYAYPLEEGKKDENVLKGLYNVTKYLKELFTSETK